MTDTKRYGMVEYSLPLIVGMDNRAEYIHSALVMCKPWLAQHVRERNYRVLGDFMNAAYEIWKFMAGPTTRSGRESKHDATEILRRAERAVITAIKAGQEAGEIGRQGEIGGWPDKMERTAHILIGHEALGVKASRMQELRAVGTLSDEQFEDALGKARAMGQVSRTNVMRIAGGGPVREVGWVPSPADRSPEAAQRRRAIIGQMAKEGADSRDMEHVLGTSALTIRRTARDNGIDIPAEKVTARTKRIDASKIVAEAIGTLDGLAMTMAMVDAWQLDRATIRENRLQIAASLRKITAVLHDMREVEEQDREHANSNNRS